MAKEERKKKTPARKRVVKSRKTSRTTRRPRRTTTKKQEAEKEIASSTSLAYLSKADLRRHIHEGLKPYQHLADQAGMHFLAYLLAMAVEEASSDLEKKN